MVATSSSAAVTATATSSASAGQLSFTVQQLARAEAVASTGTVASTAVIVATGPVTVHVGTATVNIDPGNGSLGALVDAINAVGGGHLGRRGQGRHRRLPAPGRLHHHRRRLQHLRRHHEPVGGARRRSPPSRPGRDAVIRIGEGAGAYDVTSPTDSITDLLPGVSFSLQQADPATTVTVAVAQDGNALADKVAAWSKPPTPRWHHRLQLDLRPRDQEGRHPPRRRQCPPPGRADLLGHLLTRARQQPRQRRRRRGSPWGRTARSTSTAPSSWPPTPPTRPAVAGLFREGGTATDSHVAYLTGSDNTRAGDLRRGHHAGRRPGAAGRDRAVGRRAGGGGDDRCADRRRQRHDRHLRRRRAARRSTRWPTASTPPSPSSRWPCRRRWSAASWCCGPRLREPGVRSTSAPAPSGRPGTRPAWWRPPACGSRTPGSTWPARSTVSPPPATARRSSPRPPTRRSAAWR